MNFNGSNSVISTNIISTRPNNYFASFWYDKVQNITTQTIINKGLNNDYFSEFQIQMDSTNTLYHIIGNSTNNNYCLIHYSVGKVKKGINHYFVALYNNISYVFINGNFDSVSNINGTPFYNTNKITIGCIETSGAYARNVKGNICNLIYRELNSNPNDIAARLYNSTKHKYSL